tara:strand:- start:3 stop:323 length:321 start_codon:yes stop_codon:yes gene_type:complete
MFAYSANFFFKNSFLLSKPEYPFVMERANAVCILNAGVAKLVDAPDLGSGAARRGGSSPFTRTIYQNKTFTFNILPEHIDFNPPFNPPFCCGSLLMLLIPRARPRL